MPSLALRFASDLQVVEPGQRFDLDVFVEAGEHALSLARLLLRFDPEVAQLSALAPRAGGRLEAPAAAFASGLVPLAHTHLAIAGGRVRLLSLSFVAAAQRGRSGQVRLTASELRAPDGTLRECDAAQARVVVAPAPLKIETVALPPGSTGKFTQVRLRATGGVPPVTWRATGVPTGLAVTPAGVLTGRPAAVGEFSLTFTATDSAPVPETRERAYPLALRADPLELPDLGVGPLAIGAPCRVPLSARGGTPPLSWGLAGAALPAGLSLTPQGVIEGVPMAAGDAAVIFEVSDARGRSAQRSASVRVRLFTQPPLAIATPGASLAIVAAPNLEWQPFDALLEWRVDEPALQPWGSAPLAATAWLALRVDGTVVWRGKIPNGRTRVALGRLCGGPRRIALTLERIELASPAAAAPAPVRLRLESLVITPGAGHRRASAPPVAALRPALMTAGDFLAAPVVMPGSADDLIVARDGAIEIYGCAADGQAALVSRIDSPSLSKLVAAQPGRANGHRFYGADAERTALVTLEQGAAGQWSAAAAGIGAPGPLGGLAAWDVTGDGEPEAVVGGPQGLLVVRPHSGQVLRSLRTAGTIGPEVVEVMAADLRGDGELGSAIALHYFEGRLRAFPHPLRDATSTATLRHERPAAIARGVVSPGKRGFAVASRMRNRVTLFDALDNRQLRIAGEVAAGAAPADVLLADLAAHGRPAVITADAASSTITVALPRPGAAGFGPPERFAGPRQARSVVAARGAQGHVWLVARGGDDARLLAWRSPVRQPACQVAAGALAFSQLAGTAELRRDAVLVGNAGGRELRVERIALTGAARDRFALFGAPRELPTLQPGAALALDLVFLGALTGTHTCNVAIDTDDPVHPQILLPVSATVSRSVVAVSASPGSLYLGATPVGAGELSALCTITSQGGVAGAVESVQIVEDVPGTFRIQPMAFPAPLPPMASPNPFVVLRVAGRATATGELRGVLLIHGSVGARRFVHATPLLLVGQQPRVARVVLRSAILDFGFAELGRTVERPIAGTNEGSGELRVRSARLSGPDAASFRVVGPLPLQVAPGEPLVGLRIAFTPTRHGAAAGTLTLDVNDPAQPAVGLTLRGATLSPQARLNPEIVDFGAMSLPGERTATLYNLGPLAIDVSLVESSGPFTLLFPSFPLRIPVGGSAALRVRADRPPVAGAAAGMFRLAITGADNLVLTLRARW
jgi:hypothetical protein